MTSELEARLQALVTANDERRRAQWAREWQWQGGRVVGVLCSYVPAEVLVAANVMPWRISGTWSHRIQDALVLRSANSCDFCNHVLQSLLDGDFDFLDGVVSTTFEQDITRLWDVWRHLGKTSFTHIMHLPHYRSAETTRYFAGEIREFITAVEGFAGGKIGDGDLRRAGELCNRRRMLVQELYELRKRDAPPLSGAEMLGITVAGTVLPVAQFNAELAALMPYLRERIAALPTSVPRVLVSSDFADNPAYVETIENLGCLVAMDDFDTGSRYYRPFVDAGAGDPVSALAESYLSRIGAARMLGWDSQMEQLIGWVKEFRVQGVIELAPRYSRAREMRTPFLLDRMAKAGIPAISQQRDYPPANLGQLRVRIQAFLEMLEA